MIRWVGVGVGRREGQTGCKGFCAGGDGLDGGDSYADRFYTVLSLFPPSCLCFVSPLVFRWKLDNFLRFL
jgi:hypothetical protein